jgi:hypothetical protein
MDAGVLMCAKHMGQARKALRRDQHALNDLFGAVGTFNGSNFAAGEDGAVW